MSLMQRFAGASALLLALALAGCGGGSMFGTSPGPATAPIGPMPEPSIRADDIVGRWGYSAFHKPDDRARTETAAAGQCKQAYVITRSANGVMMLGHDSPDIIENLIKANAEGKTFIGPGPDPGGPDDREVVSFDGRVLLLKWVDPEVEGRYGMMVLVRCAAPGTPTAKPKKPAKHAAAAVH
jgi:hypothetical protein